MKGFNFSLSEILDNRKKFILTKAFLIKKKDIWYLSNFIISPKCISHMFTKFHSACPHGAQTKHIVTHQLGRTVLQFHSHYSVNMRFHSVPTQLYKTVHLLSEVSSRNRNEFA